MEEIVYNPPGSTLRRDQLELLRMLKIVSKICEENKISWWLSSGTLLGAARHRGFIPWDDDMDIVLLKKDYKRLEGILRNYESEEFVFHCMKTDVDYINWFGKFRRRHGMIHSNSPRYNYYKWKGIGFDIFAIERTSFFSASIATCIYKILQSFTESVKTSWFRHFLIRSIEKVCFYILFPVLRLLGQINPKGEYHYVLGTGWPRHTFYMKDTFPLTSTEFEGEQMPVPRDMDSYLTNVYGNWRIPPSEEEIKNSIHCQEYKDELFGS